MSDNDRFQKGGRVKLRLDPKLKTPDERLSVVRQAAREHMTRSQMEYATDYLLFTADARQTAKERDEEYPIVTKNRDVTVSKRQVSYEETIDGLSNGEDGIYSMIVNDKDAILDAREPISDADVENIPGIRENMEVIETLKSQFASATGRRKYSLKCQIISKYQELYTLKATYMGFPSRTKPPSQVHTLAKMAIPETVRLDDDGYPVSDAPITLLRRDHVFFLLKYYEVLKQDTYEDLSCDMRYLLMDLERLVDRTFADQPVLRDLVRWETQGYTGSEIVEMMRNEHNIVHTEQYYSVLWRSKVPKLLSEAAQKRWLIWHYTYEDPRSARWKICNTCGKVKLAHPFFFNRNTSSDGFYSRCKCCRAAKHRQDKASSMSLLDGTAADDGADSAPLLEVTDDAAEPRA